ncbi:Trm112p-domain-containing protein [Neolentinus lepideus HHB14362 ss-1]|uniref:Trm112p-domain-containing protein n=1 Tax=Neolentinus lepideus HHB14362 ss-1 TaxID=1314782 RepID=A0A165VRR9_9AGAM|nr:Trm112p-domain-containing protein [Neolentinus lepideus HHB14362 ss-1]
MVRLITHNLLACHVRGCNSNNFPLQFQDVQIGLREAEFNPDFLRGFLPKIEWNALVDSARQLGDTSLPAEQPVMIDDDFLKTLHHVLLEIHVEEGAMVCPNCKHVYPISNGIPNMLLADHEIG